MKKSKIICIVLVFVLICSVPFSVSATSSYHPTILAPIQYDEIPHGENMKITWSAPTTGTVTKYLICMRELKVRNSQTNRLIINQVSVGASQRSYTVSSSLLLASGYYRLALGAVNSNGTTYWDEQLFYVSSTHGVRSATISLKIYKGFSTAFKDAIYYSTRSWINTTGMEKVNTYSYSNGVESSALIKGDGINTVVPYTDHMDNSLMITHTQRDSSYNAVEVDISINHAFVWVVGSQSGCYDVQNVMTHEIGHAHGLCDKYETFSSEWTMYGGSSGGETKKRTLTTNDIQAVTRLYA